MIKKNVIVTNNNFHYCTIHLNMTYKINEIKDCLHNIKHHTVKYKPLYLSFDPEYNAEMIGDVVLNLLEIANEYEIEICGIIKNENIIFNEIYGLPIVNLCYENIENKSNTLIIDYPIRGGIKIENDGDIVVTSFVSSSAEVISSGNIYIYGVANGKLIAGSNGNKKSRIFVSKFNAEFISIGGFYKVFDNNLSASVHNKPLMLYLDDKNKFIIESLNI